MSRALQALLIVVLLAGDAAGQSTATNTAQRRRMIHAANPASPTAGLSFEELWQLLNRLETERQQTNAVHYLPAGYMDAVAQVGAQGDRGDFEKLIALYETIPVESRLRETLFEPLSGFGIRLRVAELAKEDRPVPVALATNEVAAADAPKAETEVVEAWRAYRALIAKIEAEFRRVESNRWLNIHGNPKPFREALAKALREPSAEAYGNLLRFRGYVYVPRRRDGPSEAVPGLRRRILRQPASPEAATPVEARPAPVVRPPVRTDESGGRLRLTSLPLARALILCFLEQRRYDLAIATMLAANDVESSRSPATTPAAWQRQLIALAGLDWETLYAGAAAEGDSYAYFAPLARDGSARAARLLAGMPKFDGPLVQPAWLHAIGAMVTPSDLGQKYATSIRAVATRESVESIPDDVQLKLLQVLCDEVKPGAGRETLETVSAILARLCRPETKATLQQLFRSLLSRVQQHAGLALQAMGEIESLPTPPAPLIFRLLVDGQPLAGTPIHCNLLHPAPASRYRGPLRPSLTTSRRTDDTGCVTLDQDDFVDVQKPVLALLFTANRLRALDGLWFQARATTPSDFSVRTDVPITTSTLTIHIAPSKPNRQPPDARCAVRLIAAPRAETAADQVEASGDIELPLTNQIVFRFLQRGRYVVQLHAPGAALWQSEWIELTDEPAEVTAGLQPGADVKVEVAGPTADGSEGRVPFTIERERDLSRRFAEHQDASRRRWRGLPFGTYRIRTFSPQGADRGEQRTFTIDQSTPALLDLGVIRLESPD